ncbi:ASCH domain-containing protein [Novosphingobium rosa]|uniref:ASCH domain-containing protein n=1 Tax=Novosphingobium rosa TaxID=76978 RepID=UPI000835CA95|nr:ASCH domain-containing protein [Novosphingobium rosa]
MTSVRQTLLISIHPVYSDLIFKREKRVELRRKFDPALAGSRLLIYSTLPTGAIIGHAGVGTVHTLPPKEIWARFSEIAMIGEGDFWRYYAGRDRGFVIEIEDPQLFETPITLQEMRSRYDLKPPQSYMFLREDQSGILQHEHG